MIKLKYTKSFIFNNAQYNLSDENGNSIILKIDYKNNIFLIEDIENENIELKKEAKTIAKDLLKRKHAINFAKNAVI